MIIVYLYLCKFTYHVRVNVPHVQYPCTCASTMYITCIVSLYSMSLEFEWSGAKKQACCYVTLLKPHQIEVFVCVCVCVCVKSDSV